MSSKSKSSNSTRNSTQDRRQAVSDQAIAIQGGGDVTVHQVADEAFELGELAIEENRRFGESAFDFGEEVLDLGERAITKAHDTLGRSLRDTQEALYRTQDAARTESAQLSEQLIKIGIPAIAIAYVAGKVFAK